MPECGSSHPRNNSGLAHDFSGLVKWLLAHIVNTITTRFLIHERHEWMYVYMALARMPTTTSARTTSRKVYILDETLLFPRFLLFLLLRSQQLLLTVLDLFPSSPSTSFPHRSQLLLLSWLLPSTSFPHHSQPLSVIAINFFSSPFSTCLTPLTSTTLLDHVQVNLGITKTQTTPRRWNHGWIPHYGKFCSQYPYPLVDIWSLLILWNQFFILDHRH